MLVSVFLCNNLIAKILPISIADIKQEHKSFTQNIYIFSEIISKERKVPKNNYIKVRDFNDIVIKIYTYKFIDKTKYRKKNIKQHIKLVLFHITGHMLITLNTTTNPKVSQLIIISLILVLFYFFVTLSDLFSDQKCCCFT